MGLTRRCRYAVMDPLEPLVRTALSTYIRHGNEINAFRSKTWCYEGDRIVPVTVQVWDCLSSPRGAALVRESVGDGSVGATDMSRSRCPVSKRVKELCSFWNLVVLVEAVDVGVPLCRV